MKKVIVCVVLIFILGYLSGKAAGNVFPIAATANSEFCGGGAFGGTNFLVGIVEDTGSGLIVTARLFDRNGNPIVNKITIGNTTNFFTPVAFDGTHYLIIWQNGSGLYGRFIGTDGSLIGSSFLISSGIEGIGHIGFGGGKYLVVYDKCDANDYIVYGRIVDPTGSVGSEFRISSGYGKEYGGIGNLAFDGTNFLVVWTKREIGGIEYPYEIQGRFVSPSGWRGTEFSINASEAPSDNPCAVAFDGTNYLVIWPDEIGGPGTLQWFLFGQLIDKNGNKVGGVISITGNSAPAPILTPAAVFDGKNYFITWNRWNNATGWDIFGRFLDKNGSLLGNEIIIDNDANNQIGGVINSLDGQYFIFENKNFEFITSDEGDIEGISGGDVYGMFRTLKAKGDINNDGEVDITDVILCLRMAVGLPVSIGGQTYNSPYPDWLKECADMNNDEEVDITDVILILRKAVGLDL